MTMKRIFLVIFLLFQFKLGAQNIPVVQSVSFRPDTVDIITFGAKSDGITLNTKAINNSIEHCSSSGGGTVVIPSGFWLTGPLVLKSNVNLHLAEGAFLQFSRNPYDYPLIETSWEGLDAIRVHSPIYGRDLENIAITGKGIIDGAGEVWRPVKQSKLAPPEWNALVKSGGYLNEKKDTWYPTERALLGSKSPRPGVIAEGYNLKKAEAIKEFLRPNLVSLINCRRVLFEGVTFQNSPAWCLHPLLSHHLTFRNISVRNPWNAQNGDGIDIESCRYVLVEKSTFDVGDDGICIKSGRDAEGRKRGVPTEDVIVRHCTVFHGHGGFVVGSEMSGGARNLLVYDCNFSGTDIGLRFKTTRGRGGVVENVFIKNIRMNNIGGAAILFDMYYMAKDPLAMFSGEESPSMEFEPVSESTPQIRNVTIENVICAGSETAVFIRGLPEMNIKDIRMKNISIESTKGFICIEGENISLENATLHCRDKSVLTLQNSKQITIHNLQYKPADVLLTVAGTRSKEIKLLKTDGSKAKKEIELMAGVNENVISKK
jgi:DNA sulfur modification protein DndE